MNYLLVFLGGGLGAAARHAVNGLTLRWFAAGYPIGTMLINIVGSVVMGALTEYFALRTGIPAATRLLLTTGVVGGFTTFSTFSLEAVLLAQRGQAGAAAAYVVGSVILGILGLLTGMATMRYLL